MFSFQGASLTLSLQETQWSFNLSVGTSVNLFVWWRLAGSNRWPPACKAGALPAELNPHIVEIKSTTPHLPFQVKCSTVALFLLSNQNPLRWAFDLFLSLLWKVVGQNGLEPSTSRLSVVCSSQLSYWPKSFFLTLLKVHFPMYPLNWITHWQYTLYWP